MTVHEPPANPDPLARYDSSWRKQPKRIFGAVEVFRALPWILRTFQKQVPPDFWLLEGQGDSEAAVVACPCGIEPPPRCVLNVITFCDGEGCGRTFVYDGRRVLVARPPQ